MKFENNERVEQLEDQNFRGKISARYLFSRLGRSWGRSKSPMPSRHPLLFPLLRLKRSSEIWQAMSLQSRQTR